MIGGAQDPVVDRSAWPAGPQALVRRPVVTPEVAALRPRLLCVSLHDLTPATAPALPRMVEVCRSAGLERLSLLVVPDWHSGAPIAGDAAFVGRLRDLVAAGSEVVLHGHTHRAEHAPRRGFWTWLKASYFAAGEAEFLALDRAEAERRLRAGRAALEQAGLPTPAGFVAPAWLASQGAREAIAACGLAYHEDTLRLYDVARRRAYFSPVIGYGPRRAWEREGLIAYARIMSAILARNAVLRVAIHPPDVADRRTARAIGKLLARELRRREPVTYGEALARLAA